MLIIDIDFTYWKRCNFLALTSRYGKFHQENMYQALSFGVFYRFTVLAAVHLQNANTKFHKVGQRHYSSEAENVYISVRQIDSGNMYQILSSTVRFCRLYIKNSRFTVYRNLGTPKGRPTWWPPPPPSRWWFRRVGENDGRILAVNGPNFLVSNAISRLSISCSSPEMLALKFAIELRSRRK